MAFGLNFIKKIKLNNIIGEMYDRLDPETKLMINESIRSNSKDNRDVLHRINERIDYDIRIKLDAISFNGGFSENEMKNFKSYYLTEAFSNPELKKDLEVKIRVKGKAVEMSNTPGL